MESLDYTTIEILLSNDIGKARRTSKIIAAEIGFDEKESEEVALSVCELASNLAKYADKGKLIITNISNGKDIGIQIDSIDWGPGIEDVEGVIADGYSSVGSLGYGLGTVNRLMDEFKIASDSESGCGTHIICRRWKRNHSVTGNICPLSFSAVTRSCPGMQVNGDAFIIKKWNKCAIVGIIDGLGHGQYAHRASNKAREYIDKHYAESLDAIFRGTARNCYATRGVVMALARFDWEEERMTFASVGNIEFRVFNSPEPFKYVIRRGILGVNAPNPIVSEYSWNNNYAMVLFSDGIKTHWKKEDIMPCLDKSAGTIAQHLLRTQWRETDDATVVVVKENIQ